MGVGGGGEGGRREDAWRDAGFRVRPPACTLKSKNYTTDAQTSAAV